MSRRRIAIFAIELAVRPGNGVGMVAGPAWIKAELKRTGAKQIDLARAMGLDATQLSKTLSGRRRLIADELERAQSFFEELRFPERPSAAELAGTAPGMVRVVGYVGAGATAHYYEVAQGDLDEVKAPEGSTPQTVAVEVRGTSLGPLFDRWLVFYDDVRRPVTADLIGKLCVVGLEDERVLVKKLQRGRAPGLFNLISQAEDPIEDIGVRWAARVNNMTPRS
jgi:lambda repressor-like predicted transcriptional regulator